jgi:NAD(P)-dependent dehydrogenase (short-subunit alcohol dehydrogenase family)
VAAVDVMTDPWGGFDVMTDPWGGFDLLVDNAVDTAPGSMVPIVDLSVVLLESKLVANAVAPFVLIRAVLPGMFERAEGTIVDVTSQTAASKAAANRFAPLLAVELGDRGIRAYNVDPGYVETERQVVNAAAPDLVGHYRGAPRSVPAAAIAWMVDHPEAVENGQTIRAQKLALVEVLHPDWRTA